VTLRTGQPAKGYVVLRGLGAQAIQVCQTSGALQCIDTAPGAGQQTYRVYARFGPWTGQPSDGTTYTHDSTAPTTTASPDGSSPIATSPVSVTLTATDTGSGVASISYRIDSGSLVTVNGAVATFSVTGPGTKTIKYRATDNVGNVEAERTVVLNISPPPAAPTNLRIGADSGVSASDGITNVAANRVLGSGAPGTTVEVRRGSTLVGTGTVTPAGTFDVPVTLVDGAQNLSVQLVNAAGVASAATTLQVTLDQVAPVVVPRTPNLQNENKWDRVCEDIGLQPGLCGTVTDTSDIAQVTYEVRGSSALLPFLTFCWDGDSWELNSCGFRTAIGTSPWSVPMPWDTLSRGSAQVRIRATDVAGNTNDTTSPTYTFTRS
jgi:hypothetical protein